MKWYKQIVLLSVMTVAAWSATDITDGCDLPDLNLYLSEDGKVFYNSSEAIGGFQFNIDGTTASGASVGDAGSADMGNSSIREFSPGIFTNRCYDTSRMWHVSYSRT